MSVEILLFVVLGAISLLAYMIAINSRGATRLSLSYLLATAILAGSVGAVVRYVNSDQALKKNQEMKKLEMQRKAAEELAREKEIALQQNKERTALAAELTGIITRGVSLATALQNTNLTDPKYDIDQLMRMSIEADRKAAAIKSDISKIDDSNQFFPGVLDKLTQASKLLSEATYYYKAFYRSEDSEQEQLRRRILQSKSKEALNEFEACATMLAQTPS